MKKLMIFMTILLIILIFLFGFLSSQIYNYYFKEENHSNAEGYWFKNTKEPEFNYGDWVCVNIKGMNFERALAVCRHEIGHEIFAEYCEQNNQNWEECSNLTK